MVAVHVDSLVKRYGAALAVDRVSFTAEDGEFVTLLGPSGCGKTTSLRCIAGLERPDGGSITIGEQVVAGPGTFVPIHQRHIGMVFQSYAVWPHMTVTDNVGFPLKLRKVRDQERTQRVQQALDLVDLGNLGQRYPFQLSGGQQQRVALARALVYNPRVLLLDEPLSNLDAKLREQMRAELRSVQKSIGVTAIYVTHDQAEAMELSDKIVVMSAGRIEQIGDAVEIYRHPRTSFVRTFVGLVNEVTGTVQDVTDGQARVAVEFGTVTAQLEPGVRPAPGETVHLWIRPEDLEVTGQRDGATQNAMPATVTRVVFQGNAIEYWLENGQITFRAEARNTMLLREGDAVTCLLPADRVRLAQADPAPVS